MDITKVYSTGGRLLSLLTKLQVEIGVCSYTKGSLS